jgi:6-hydroxynicotinate reductase
MPRNAFGYVPTPALVAPIEFTLKLTDYAALGGYVENVRPLSSILRDQPALDQFVHDEKGPRHLTARPDNPWPLLAGKDVANPRKKK